ncbi:hypothetical protein EDD16DRAFT_1038876 [Pisolithus croceorrhizus]|nr:hypothetical protein F5141DRAFT_823429 [Pisolithus sp. B1]KAI6116916.1 hypothetical protein EDD16DRAFT_1038876 [Pisolithus croceorrhizus]
MRTFVTRFVPRALLPSTKVVPPPLTKKQERASKDPLIKIMQRRQEEAGKSWPMNLRIEPILSRRTTGSFPKAVRSKMRKLLTER